MWGAEVSFLLSICLTFQLPQAHQLLIWGEFQGPNQNKAQRIGERLSKAEFQPGELKLARQNLAQLTDQAWACLGLQWTGKTEFLEDCTNPLENLF